MLSVFQIHDMSCDRYFESYEREAVMKYFKNNNIDPYFHIGDFNSFEKGYNLHLIERFTNKKLSGGVV